MGKISYKKRTLIGCITLFILALLCFACVFSMTQNNERVFAEKQDYTVYKSGEDFVGIGINEDFDGAFYAGVKPKTSITEAGLNFAVVEYRLDNTIFDKENGGLLIHLSTMGRTKDFVTRVYAFVGETMNRMMNAHAGLDAAQCTGVSRYFIADDGEIKTLAFSRTNNRLTINKDLSGTLVLPWKHMTDSTNGEITTNNPTLRIVILTDLSSASDTVRADQGIIVSSISTYTYDSVSDQATVVKGISTKDLTYTNDANNTTADVNLADITKGAKIFCKREWNTSASVSNFKADTDNSNVGKMEFEKLSTVSLINGEQTSTLAVRQGKTVTLPTATMVDKTFVGWTTNDQTVENLYNADYVATINGDTNFYSVGVDFTMVDGAAIRIANKSNGIKFKSTIATADYEILESYITKVGTFILPTKYVETTDFVLENFELGVTILEVENVNGWLENEENYSYYGSLTNVLDQNTNLSFSARGYILVEYTDGSAQYIYTNYNETNNSRSIYQVANLAYADEEDVERKEKIKVFIDKVADLTVGNAVSVNNDVAGYGITSSSINTDGQLCTVVLDGNVSVLTLNGVRISNDANVISNVMIDSIEYQVTNFNLVTNESGSTLSFILVKVD